MKLGPMRSIPVFCSLMIDCGENDVEAVPGISKLRWTPITGQLGGLDLLWAFRANRLAEPGAIDLARGRVVQRLVKTFLVVELEVGRQARLQIHNMLRIFDLDILVFHAPPQPLHEDVVQRTPPTVPAHRDPSRLQPAGVLP